jgi:hypothetical protein
MPIADSDCPSVPTSTPRKEAPPSCETRPPNCHTCPHKGHGVGTMSWICNAEKEPFYLCNGSDDIIINHRGCLFHPRAREWLNRDVIKELERRANVDRTAYVPANVRKSTLEEALALLKGGVGE